MKKQLQFILLIIAIAIVTTLAGCGTTAEEPDESANDEVPGETTSPNDEGNSSGEEVEPSDSENGETGEGTEPNNNEAEVDMLTVTGEYVGIADLHTFEITTDEVEDGFIAFQFYDEEMTAMLEEMEVGQEVTVTYTTNEHGQHIVDSIK